MNTIDHAIAWRDEQIEMLRQEVRDLTVMVSHAQEDARVQRDRAEAAEDRLRIMREEIGECLPTP